MAPNKYAVIPAGGKGIRMGKGIPKQFIEIAGKPVLMHTLEVFYKYSPQIEIILVLPADDITYWQELCEKYNFHIPHQQQYGGTSRYESVKHGLQCINDSQGLVAIHDGVRPLVSKDLIGKTFETASHSGAAIPAVPLKDTIRKVVDSRSYAVNRHEYRIIQTPQTFQTGLIQHAYQTPQSQLQTDDAGVAENAGHTVTLIEGEYSNIKITSSEDIWIADMLLRNGQLSG